MKTRCRRSISLLLFTFCSIAGCASQAQFQHAASAAADQLASVEKVINAKVKAENRYYDEALKRTAQDLNRWRVDSRTHMLQEKRDAFMASNTGKNAATLGSELEQLIESTIDDLQQQDAIKDRLQSAITTTLETSRKKIAYEIKKIRALRGKLSVLGESRDNNALLRFIVSYAREVSVALEALEKDSAGAAGAAVKAGDE